MGSVKYDNDIQLRQWRATKFRELGFSPEQVHELLDLGVDYRYAEALMRSKCTADTFMRIVR